jgi:hypothetical protein
VSISALRSASPIQTSILFELIIHLYPRVCTGHMNVLCVNETYCDQVKQVSTYSDHSVYFSAAVTQITSLRIIN